MLLFLYLSDPVRRTCACQIVPQALMNLLCLGLERPHCQEGPGLSLKMRHDCSLESNPGMMPSLGIRGRQHCVD